MAHWCRGVSLLVSLLLVVLSAAAQQRTDFSELIVRIVASNSPVSGGVAVELLRDDREVANVFTNELGEAKFDGIPAGNYAVKINGPGLTPASSQEFRVGAEERPHLETVQVQSDTGATQVPPTAMVSKVAMRVPAKAAKEFDRGNQALADRDVDGAIRHLQKAVDLYPDYAAAYNNLGSAFARIKDWAKSTEAYQKAISIDDRQTDAYVNLARILAMQNNYPQAEDLLAKDLTFDPLNPSALMLMSSVELRLGKYDQCLSNLHKMGGANAKAYPYAHYLAAVASRAKNDIPAAISEYVLFLKETAPNAYTSEAQAALKELRTREH